MEPGTGFVYVVPAERHEQVANIDQQVVVGEGDRTEVRNLGKQRDGEAGDDGSGHAGEPIAQHQSQTGAQEGERKTADGLVGLEMDGNEGVSQAQQPAGGDGSQQTEPDVAALVGDLEASHGAHQHHAFNTQVLDARAFGEGLADGSDEQNGTGGNAGAEDFDPVHWAVS